MTYSFLSTAAGGLKERFRTITNDKLVRQVFSRSCSPTLVDKLYSDENKRVTFLAVQLELNERLLIMPIKRPWIVKPPHRHLSDAQSQFSNDQMVIDLHWLFCCRDLEKRTGCLITIPRKFDCVFGRLYDGSTFNFEVAADLAISDWTTEHIVKLMSVPSIIQSTCVKLKSRRIRERQRRTDFQAETITLKLLDQCNNPMSRLQKADINEYLDAHRYLRDGEGSPSIAVAMAELSKGESLTESERKKQRKSISSQKRVLSQYGGEY